MDPCPYVRLMIDSLSLNIPVQNRPAGSDIYPSTTNPSFCILRIKGFPSQTVVVPVTTSAIIDASPPESSASSAGFHIDTASIRRLSRKSVTLTVSVYTGRMGSSCSVTCRKFLGRIDIGIELNGMEKKTVIFQNGWMKIGSESRLHMTVRAEPDPRFVFQFGDEPEYSPVVFQIQGNIRQPVFNCKFSADRNARSRIPMPEFMRKSINDRKGWIITIHDLSGSPIAAASMITPFVASPGSDRVSRSNPGAWLILRPHRSFDNNDWKPWGRLEAWREKGPIDSLGYKFELVRDTWLNVSGTTIAEGTISMKKGGQFYIDNRMIKDSVALSLLNPSIIRGFVMSSTVEAEGKVSKPTVLVGVQHVTCMADAALFVALSAAMDLSMDACRLFPISADYCAYVAVVHLMSSASSCLESSSTSDTQPLDVYLPSDVGCSS
ncbi:uncharacterized protein LOC124916027 [Impatiens glandulifera]|uniref:uncharacterized protein LOC124916027 n=1 Tax=Impatiens glandulifera TaxID=253017 RepID=UPI001FB05900|nr:uncharacterized protein LOC124916027 [Impatiens glandulifera]